MPLTQYKGYSVQASGANIGTWGAGAATALNEGVIEILDNNFAGVTVLSLGSSNVLLSTSQTQNGTIVLTGTLTGNVAVTPDSGVLFNGRYIVENRTSGNFTVSISNGVGFPVLVPQGTMRDLFADSVYGVRAMGLPPPGTFLDLGSTTPHPSLLATSSLLGEYLVCDGSVIATTGVTANLYQAIATTWGSGPNLPDLRGRGRFGTNLGTSRITTASSGINGNTVGSVGGVEAVTLTSSQIPANIPNGATGFFNRAGYQLNNAGATTGGGGVGTVPLISTLSGQENVSVTVTINPSGGNLHSNMPPTGIVNVLIKV